MLVVTRVIKLRFSWPNPKHSFCTCIWTSLLYLVVIPTIMCKTFLLRCVLTTQAVNNRVYHSPKPSDELFPKGKITLTKMKTCTQHNTTGDSIFSLLSRKWGIQSHYTQEFSIWLAILLECSECLHNFSFNDCKGSFKTHYIFYQHLTFCLTPRFIQHVCHYIVLPKPHVKFWVWQLDISCPS